MIVTKHRMDELDRIISIEFYNTKDTEGQLYTHTYSYLYLRSQYEELGDYMPLGTPTKDYQDLKKKIENKQKDFKNW